MRALAMLSQEDWGLCSTHYVMQQQDCILNSQNDHKHSCGALRGFPGNHPSLALSLCMTDITSFYWVAYAAYNTSKDEYCLQLIIKGFISEGTWGIEGGWFSRPSLEFQAIEKILEYVWSRVQKGLIPPPKEPAIILLFIPDFISLSYITKSIIILILPQSCFWMLNVYHHNCIISVLIIS